MAASTLGETVRSYHAALQQALDCLPLHTVQRIAHEILVTWERGAQIYVFGNGGSAATASHMACDLGKNTVGSGEARLRSRLRIRSLTDNVALITALANDLGYEAIFAEQLVQAPVRAMDLAIAISGSGNSANVLAGIAVAREAGARTVGITGFDGGRLAPAVDIPLVVASSCIEIVEDVHLMINHAITSALRAALHDQPVEVADLALVAGD